MFDKVGLVLQALQEIAGRHRPVSTADERTLPVLEPLRALLPGGGLRRGATVVITGSTAVLLAVLAGPSAAGLWCAVLGMPWLGVVAAAEAGIALPRLALIPEPGPDWATIAAALIDGFDVVALAAPAHVRAADARRLAARARERGAVLLPVTDNWPGADVRVRAGPSRWIGLGDGYGHLRARYISVAVEGRGAAARPRHGRLWLPGLDEHVGAAPARAPTRPDDQPVDLAASA